MVVAMHRIVVVFGSLLLAAAAAADPLSADRPGVANPPHVVAPGAIQLEGGLSFQRETQGGGPDTNTLTVPGGLLRVGLVSPLELRVSAVGYELETSSGGKHRSSGSDLVIGSRARLLDQQGIRPATALEFDLSLPTGSDAVTSGGVDPSGLLLVEWGFWDRFVLDGNLGLASVSLGENDASRAVQVAPSLSLGASIDARANVFIEWYATFSSRGVADQPAVDAGLSWLVDDDLQLDVSVGAGLDDAAPDFTVSAGIAWRFFLP
jgi:Putative MetA-pathway of phenol degradation